MSAPSNAPGHKGAQHWMNKRWLQLQQRRGETGGTRVGTDFAEEFKNMQKVCSERLSRTYGVKLLKADI
jgi:hypothetical protein